MKKLLWSLVCLLPLSLMAQPGYWQQRVRYSMDIKLDVQTNKLTGRQDINYTNNSPDTLKKIFFHLYWNAFRPGSMMDEGVKESEQIVLGKTASGNTATDFDRRFKKKIADMLPEEEGYCHVTELSIGGIRQKIEAYETILMVALSKPVLPHTSILIQTQFEAQVPKLSRRSGRDSDEGIRYSMGQWYPKIVEYDQLGWHPDDYTGHEFYGVWGDYDVKLTLEKSYKVGATGQLQNATAIGWGYDKEGTPLKNTASANRTWHFSGKNIHDFVWSADPGYKHITRQVPNGPLLHFIYKNDPAIETLWQTTADTCAIIFPYLSKTFGRYAYPVYSFLQGGGGGTEYPMATLIKNGSLETAVHEMCHSWYQMMLGTNEILYPWMDEGFANYAEAKALAWLRHQDFFENISEYGSYANLAKSPFDEPMCTPANAYATNFAYNTNAYSKGKLFLLQLGYITGEHTLEKILLEYYRQWAFKHPTPDDLVKIAEEQSGIQLQWYKNYMVNTTKTIDYAIDSLWEEGGESKIRLRRIGEMPMPLDVQLRFRDSSTELHYIPLNLMYGHKRPEDEKHPFVLHQPWSWLQPVYVLSFKQPLTNLTGVEIDPGKRMADMDRRNNSLTLGW